MQDSDVPPVRGTTCGTRLAERAISMPQDRQAYRKTRPQRCPMTGRYVRPAPS